MNTNIDYNDAPMMNLSDYNDHNETEGIDLNMVDSETLDILYTIRQTIWVTEIHLNENNEIVFAYEVIFTVRIYLQITERMRIIWEGRKYRILSIELSKQIQKLTIRAELINE